MFAVEFRQTAIENSARAGVATTHRGEYQTPCFMPVGTRGAIRHLSAQDYEELGAKIKWNPSVKSKNDNFNLIKKATARGKNKQIAKEMTEGVGFEFLLEDDNLIFDDFFTISTQKWRMQELDLTLEIPVGMVVFLDHSLEDLIYDIKNVHNMWDYDMLGHYWKMEKEGLSCISCE